MKPGSNRRVRSRPNQNSNNNNKRQGGRNSYDSNGPDGKVRGTAQQVLEKYQALARDATSAGDRIAAEGYFQFAEHYYRVVNADGAAQQPRNDQNSDELKQQENVGNEPSEVRTAPKQSRSPQPTPNVVSVPIMPGPISAPIDEPQPELEAVQAALPDVPVKEPVVAMEEVSEDQPKPVRRRRARVKPAPSTESEKESA